VSDFPIAQRIADEILEWCRSDDAIVVLQALCDGNHLGEEILHETIVKVVENNL
jgi:hypothetical protein